MKFQEFIDNATKNTKDELSKLTLSDKEKYNLQDGIDMSSIRINYDLNMSCLLGMITQLDENGKSVVKFIKPSLQSVDIVKTYVSNYFINSILSSPIIDRLDTKDLRMLSYNIKNYINSLNLELV